MSKELFVSLTPHETKVAVSEEDQLTEIYFERENEYTLAGSIYKGRVTRVLPGMQSAFVEIGLERDAFLYVSDFFEMEDEQDEFDPVKIEGTRPEFRSPDREDQQVQPHLMEAEPQPRATSPIVFEGPEEPPAGAAEESSTAAEAEDSGRGFRGRGGRRRRGRRGRAFPESKFARGEQEEQPRESNRDESYGPPAGYQPVVLPGESISKFSQGTPAQPPQALPGESIARFSPSQPPPEEPPRAQERVERERRPERGFDRGRGRDRDRGAQSYGPPPGFQPIVLPGESISKYSRMKASPAALPVAAEPLESASGESSGALDLAAASDLGSESGQYEPPRAEAHEATEPPVIEEQSLPQALAETPVTEAAGDQTEYGDDEQRFDQMNVAAVFGGAEATEIETPPEAPSAVDLGKVEAAHDEEQHQYGEARAARATSSQTVEHEEIEEEEPDLPLVAEPLDDADDFEELEEETLEAHPAHAERNGDLAAIGEELTEAAAEPEAIEEYEEDEENGEEVEYEAAEADEAGEGGEGEEDTAARAELRAPAGTAGYQQRTQRPPYERRGRGRRGGRRSMRQTRPMQRQQVMISDMLKEGQEIVVQIAKEPIGKKGARITSHIALPGRFLVYMPTVNHIGVSRKISSDEERQRLKRIVMGERDAPGHGGFIVRTAAENVAEDELRADIRFLKNLWNEIKTRADESKAPALIYHDLNLVERTLRDQLTEDFTHVWVDNEQEYERVLRFVNRFQPNLVRRVRLYTKETPLFEQFGIHEEINKALKSKVWLKSGGYIVINQTEALVAIDVNTGKYVGKTSRLEDTIVKTNVDAIKEIVRQIRLRDLGGIIVIDFIDMDERKNRQKVMQALEEALRGDRAPSKVLQFNDFGLVAITRKRVKHSLERTLGTPCPYCTGTGLVKSVETVCNEIYIEMKKMRSHLEGHEILLRVNPEVAKELKANNARWLNDLEELSGKSIIIKPDASLHQEQFDM
jgi:Rne/Rng family ribonuclease